jgi:predicted nucleic acid-binding protein
MIALIDADDRHHRELLGVFEGDSGAWVLPWAILPEVDYLVGAHVGSGAQDAFLADLAADVFRVEWGTEGDLARAHELHRKHRALRLGLTDSVVIAIAERLGADAIATLDVGHFGAVPIRGNPRLLPRDL